MKYPFVIFLLLSLLFIACADRSAVEHIVPASNTSIEIPDIAVQKSKLDYDKKTSVWTLDGSLFSGYAVVFYQDSSLQEKVGIFDGKKQNQTTQWYPDGHYKQIAHYEKGKLHGLKQKWGSDESHVLITQLNYYQGKAHGEQKIWYPSGELFKKLNLRMGREEGLQQAFRKNGALFANYEAREGRIFGLKKAALCYGLENENIQYEN